jgi:hypothetical protein
LMYPVPQDPQASCNVPLLYVYVQVYSLVWVCLCLKFYWMFYLEIKKYASNCMVCLYPT